MVFGQVLRRIRHAAIGQLLTQSQEQTRLMRNQHDFLLNMKWAMAAQDFQNPLNHFGAKFFSQSDEDGITLEIIRRLELKTGAFLEFGVGDGTENNTLVLLSIGWRGAWVGGENLAFDPHVNPKRLFYKKAWVSLDNINELVRSTLSAIAASDVDVLNVDLDGNDLYFTEALLNVLHPKLVIVEYNAKFPPPARWSVEYDPNFRWDGTDYHGASLASFCDLLARFGYTLVCCNAATGANAFFVNNNYRTAFKDVPQDINNIFISPKFQLPVHFGHPASPKTIAQMLSGPGTATA
jgi:hypothetical protein